jgi:hypothetical protein
MIDNSTPTGSSLAGLGSRDSGTKSVISTMLTSTTGTLIRKTEPHQKCSISSPPVIGPMATARPTPPAQMPMALPRSSAGNTLEMIASVAGMMAAPPTPMKARAAINCAGSWA